MLSKSRAIVLHQLKYGESSLIVTLYAEKFGRLTCMVNGVRSKKSRFPGNLFQPLTLLEVDFYYRQHRDLQRLKEALCPCPYTSVLFSPSKSATALFLAELLYLTLREEESNPQLFSFLFHSFQLFDALESGMANFHLWFLLHFARFLGILTMNPDDLTESILSSDLVQFRQLPEEARKALTLLVTHPQGPPEILRLTGDLRALLLDRIIRHYAQHIEGFNRLKSMAVLQEVFR
jgi:DNA repair protein RecO (recombination protein O)